MLKKILIKIISYFSEVSLEITGSHYNPYLEVLMVNGRHQLVTKNAIYSFDDKYENFYRSFEKINWKEFKCKSVLILGMGLGSVIYILEKSLKKDFEYTCVEIDSEIIRLANSYTIGNLTSLINIYETDAETFINVDQEKYDLILMDVFQNAKVPKKFEQEEFLSKLKSKLNPNGLILYNRMYEKKSNKLSTDTFAISFKKVFPNTETLMIKDNLMFFSDHHQLKKLP